MDVRVYGEHDERVTVQPRRCAGQEDGAHGVLTPPRVAMAPGDMPDPYRH